MNPKPNKAYKTHNIFRLHYKAMLARELYPISDDSDTITKLNKLLSDENYIFEPKYDGTRALLYYNKGRIKILNRRGVDISYRYPELSKIKLRCNQAIIDGEIVAIGSNGKINFNLLQQREHLVSRFEIALKSKLIPVMYIAFDILYLDGKDLLLSKLIERKKLLDNIVIASDLIRTSTYTKDGKWLYDITKKQDIEGIIAKRIDSTYKQGKRTLDWIKIKHFKTLDCIVFFYTKGKGKRKESFGSLGLGIINKGYLTFIGKVGSGFDENSLEIIKRFYLKDKTLMSSAQILENFIGKYGLRLAKPTEIFDSIRKSVKGLDDSKAQKHDIFLVKPFVIEIKFQDLSDNHMLRCPIFVKIRNDKLPLECVM